MAVADGTDRGAGPAVDAPPRAATDGAPGTAPDPATREVVRGVACHVLARARFQAVGRFGLRASPGGIATPAFGPDHAVIRLSGARMVVERDRRTIAVVGIDGATLAGLADVAGADLSTPFSVGQDTPPLGAVHDPLTLDHGAALRLGDWYGFAWQVLDDVLAGLPTTAAPTCLQLWPEHFDVGCDVAAPASGRANLGASPGDAWHPGPYLYVGPWTDARPGPEAFWNAPFGAVRSHAELVLEPDPHAAGVAFLRHGLRLLG